MRRILAVVLATTLLPPFLLAASATEFRIDPAHSSVNFKVRHLVSKTAGKFDKFSGTINHEAGKPETWKVEAHIDAASINTNEPKRDKHLRSADFFDTDKNKELVFKSTGVKDVNDKTAKLEGTLTMHGVTKPVVLAVEMGGEGTDPWGNHSIGFTASTKLNRKDFGLTWNKALEAGGFLIGEDVEVVLEIEAHATTPAKKAKK